MELEGGEERNLEEREEVNEKRQEAEATRF